MKYSHHVLGLLRNDGPGVMDIKRAIKRAANALGFEISRRRPPQPAAPPPGPQRQFFEALMNVRESATDAIPFLKYCARNMDKSYAERFQDLLVLFLL